VASSAAKARVVDFGPIIEGPNERRPYATQGWLRIEIPGPVVSGNQSTRFGNGRAYVSTEAREYKARVKSIAFSEAARARWKAPAYAAVDVYVYNVRVDCDNACKKVLDGLQGTVIRNDASILALHVRKRKDRFGARVVVIVTEANALEAGYSRAKKGKA
jgi:Holliday junction resolvase RusA-like endonuclease